MKQNQGDAVFFDIHGIMHHEYAPDGQTVTKEYYQQVLRRLHDAVQCGRSDFWMAKNWQLQYDNAPAHSSHPIQTFLEKHRIPIIHQPPSSPDMAPCDFCLFPKLKMTLKGSCFENREEIMQNVMAEMNTIPKEAFQKCFWWAKCVKTQGVYFEGD